MDQRVRSGLVFSSSSRLADGNRLGVSRASRQSRPKRRRQSPCRPRRWAPVRLEGQAAKLLFRANIAEYFQSRYGAIEGRSPTPKWLK